MKVIVVAASAAFLAAAGPQGSQPVTVHQVMKEAILPHNQVLADLSTQAMDDDGKPDASKLGAAEWQKLIGAATAMREGAMKLATAPQLAVALAGDKLQDEGSPGSATREQMQKGIDADRKGFTEQSQALVDALDAVLAAANAKDAAKLLEASGRVDETCQSCHARFWYPPQG